MGVNSVSGYSYSYSYNGYSPMLDSESWVKNAENAAKKLESSSSSNKTSGTDSTSSSSSSSYVSSSSSTSTFLLGYQSALEDLEAASAKLQTSAKDNVFAKYEAALREDAMTKVPEKEDGTTVKKADKAADDIVSAVKDFAQKYNDVISFLSSNSNRSSAVASQLESLKRSIPTDQTLKAVGLKVDTSGKLQVDEEGLREALEKDPEEVKYLLGGQFGIADRVGDKATTILDSPVNKIVGGTSDSDSTTKKSNSSSSTNSNTTGAYLNSSSIMSDSFLQFANFAKSGAYNLSNYYSVSMLNMLV